VFNGAPNGLEESSGGFNFDAKLQRQSLDPGDLLHAHIGGIDTLAAELRNAARLIQEKSLAKWREQRYRAWDGELGRSILEGKYALASLADYALEHALDPRPVSASQERLENPVHRVVYRGGLGAADRLSHAPKTEKMNTRNGSRTEPSALRNAGPWLTR